MTLQTIPINGIEMSVETAGTGEPLLLLHGFTGCGADWRRVFEGPPQGFQTFAPDLRGHGRSTNPAGQFTHRQAALDVLALLDHLGIDRFKAIGVSAGAKTLLHAATQQPRRVQAQVLVSAAPYFPDSARALMDAVAIETRTGEEWRVMRERHTYGDEQIRMLWRQARGFKDSYEDMNFTPPLLSTIAARTLIVHGDRDPFYPVELAVQMYRAIPTSSLWIVPGGGHGPISGPMLGPFRDAALAFLRETC